MARKGQKRNKLTYDKAVEICIRRNRGEKGVSLARIFHVTPNTIYCITNGASWRTARIEADELRKRSIPTK